MKLCIPTQDDSTPDTRICPHFGKARYHLVFENGQLTAEHTKDQAPDATCAPIDWIIAQGVTHVICLGIGDGAFRRLNAAGIQVLSAGKLRWVHQALAAPETLTPFDPARLCDHHDHSH